MLGSWIGLVAGLLGIVFGVLALWLARRPQGAVEPERVVIKEVEEVSEVPEIDTEWKKRHREELARDWERNFLDALGDGAEGLVREWGKDSPRLELARLLKADEEEARKRKDWHVSQRVRRMRVVLTSNPELPFSAGEMDLMHAERERWHRKWAA